MSKKDIYEVPSAPDHLQSFQTIKTGKKPSEIANFNAVPLKTQQYPFQTLKIRPTESRNKSTNSVSMSFRNSLPPVNLVRKNCSIQQELGTEPVDRTPISQKSSLPLRNLIPQPAILTRYAQEALSFFLQRGAYRAASTTLDQKWNHIFSKWVSRYGRRYFTNHNLTPGAKKRQADFSAKADSTVRKSTIKQDGIRISLWPLGGSFRRKR